MFSVEEILKLQEFVSKNLSGDDRDYWMVELAKY